ncbi:hypothetical protein F5888DRAFT_628685 [Russula emetica]|nr:hypothetical protein F5888DRAFT_628685 [Russula emetica]
MSSLLLRPINPVLLLMPPLRPSTHSLSHYCAAVHASPTECKAGYSWMPRRHTPTLRFTTYTPRTLVNLNEHDGGRILFAIARIVFDVTGGKCFYGPDGMYWRVAGRDASPQRSVAMQSFDFESEFDTCFDPTGTM